MPRCLLCKDKFKPKVFLQKHCFEKDECIEAERVYKFKKQCKDERKEFYKDNKSLSSYEADARKVFQRWIRKRDENRPCISCNCLTAIQWDGGHFLKAELFSGLIFNEKNCHKQCSVCNDHKSGNELEYRDGLINRYGSDYVTGLEATKNENRKYQYTKHELTEIKNKYLKLLKP